MAVFYKAVLAARDIVAGGDEVDDVAILNRESDYAIRILRALSDGIIHSMEDVCKNQYMGKAFAYKISKKMEQGGFVEIVRGKQGGLRLSTDLSKLSLYDVMEVADNKRHINECLKNGYVCEYADNKGCCTVKTNLIKVQDRIDKELKNCMISELI